MSKQLSLFTEEQEPAAKGAVQVKSKSYDEFVAKFEPKKTTDDCYTPEPVFNAVFDWVKANCDWREGDELLRPFRPGGDYLAETYTPNTVVVDNPPFSIFSQIVNNYTRLGIRYFLFAPHLTLFSAATFAGTRIVCSTSITYANGANVNTDFVTNMLPTDIAVTTAPTLARAIEAAVDAIRAEQKRKLPVYKYPDELVTSARLGLIAKQVVFQLRRNEIQQVERLDAQRPLDKAIFGKGLLVSRKKAAELKAAELKAAREVTVFPLSEREQAMVDKLSDSDD